MNRDLPFALFPEHAHLREQILSLTEPVASPRSLLVPGVTGSGKTHLARWLAQQPAVQLHGAVTHGGGTCGPDGLISALLDTGDPARSESEDARASRWSRNEERLDAAIDAFTARSTRVIVVDEADAVITMRDAPPSDRRAVASILRLVSRRARAHLVLLGSPAVAGFAQCGLQDVVGTAPLGAVGDSATYRTWLTSIETQMAYDGACGRLGDDVNALRLLDLGQGFVGLIEYEARASIGAVNGGTTTSLASLLAGKRDNAFAARLAREWRRCGHA